MRYIEFWCPGEDWLRLQEMTKRINPTKQGYCLIKVPATGVSSPQIMYHFSIEFLELAVSCLGLGEGGCDCTALAMH